MEKVNLKIKNLATMKITSIKMYRSNAEIFAKGNGEESNYFHVDFDNLSQRAKNDGGSTLKRAVVNRLRQQYSQYKFIVPSEVL